MKFRIIETDDKAYPFIVQEKFLWWWTYVDAWKTLEAARQHRRRLEVPYKKTITVIE